MASVSFVRGKYRALVRLKGHRPLQASFDTEAEARQWGKAREDEILAGIQHPRASDTIHALAERLLKEIKDNGGTPNHGLAYGMSMVQSTKIKHPIADIPLGKLTREAVTNFCASPKITNGGKASHALVEFRLTWVRRLLRHCARVWSMQVPNVVPASIDTLKSSGRTGQKTERDRRVTDDELNRICKAARELTFERRQYECNYDDFFRVAMLQSFRRAELANLLWADLNPEEMTAYLKNRKHPTKKVGNNQYAPMMHEAIEILLRQPKLGPRIFMASPSEITRAFRAAAKKAGVSDIHLHDLRHEAISRLIESGESEQAVMMYSGHRTSRMLARYTHLIAKRMSKARQERARGAAAPDTTSPEFQQAVLAAAMKLLKAQMTAETA